MKNAPSATIKTVLRQLLNYAHLTANGLATALQLPTPTVHRLITGEVRDPRLSTMVLIADYFGITIEQLVGRKPLSKKFETSQVQKKQDKKYVFSVDMKVIELNSKKSRIIGIIVES